MAKKTLPKQHQERQPGRETEMQPAPESSMHGYRAAGKLLRKVALITGGDSGIGRAVAVAFAKEGADIAIVYLDEHEDANKTKNLVEQQGRLCLLLSGDVGDPEFCRHAVAETRRSFGHLDILVNNAGEQHQVDDPAELSDEQLHRTFQTNVFGAFYMTRSALPHLREGAAIINSTSVTAFRGQALLVDYSATKGALLGFTRALAQALANKGIRVNAVAPGPIWTPLIPASFDAEKVENFGGSTPMGRPGQPDEVAPCYVFLASNDASYMTGQVLHPNGGEIVA